MENECFCVFALHRRIQLFSAVRAASAPHQAWQTPSRCCPISTEKAPSWPLWLSSHWRSCMRLGALCCHFFGRCGWFHFCFHCLLRGWDAVWSNANLTGVCGDSFVRQSENNFFKWDFLKEDQGDGAEWLTNVLSKIRTGVVSFDGMALRAFLHLLVSISVSRWVTGWYNPKIISRYFRVFLGQWYDKIQSTACQRFGDAMLSLSARFRSQNSCWALLVWFLALLILNQVLLLEMVY